MYQKAYIYVGICVKVGVCILVGVHMLAISAMHIPLFGLCLSLKLMSAIA